MPATAANLVEPEQKLFDQFCSKTCSINLRQNAIDQKMHKTLKESRSFIFLQPLKVTFHLSEWKLKSFLCLFGLPKKIRWLLMYRTILKVALVPRHFAVQSLALQSFALQSFYQQSFCQQSFCQQSFCQQSFCRQFICWQHEPNKLEINDNRFRLKLNLGNKNSWIRASNKYSSYRGIWS